jgi:hypothetical protein
MSTGDFRQYFRKGDLAENSAYTLNSGQLG